MNKNINEIEVTIFDTETTGLQPQSGDRIVEIAAIKVKGEQMIATFSSLINPGRPISPAAFQVNKIGPEMLKDAPGPEKVICELPGGRLDEGEDHVVTAERELLEETGFKGELTYLGSRPYTPYSTGILYMYMAINCQRIADLKLDPQEFLEVKLYPLEDFKKML